MCKNVCRHCSKIVSIPEHYCPVLDKKISRQHNPDSFIDPLFFTDKDVMDLIDAVKRTTGVLT